MFKKTLILGLILSAFALVPFTGSQVSAATTTTVKAQEDNVAWWGWRGGYRGYWGGWGYGGYRPYYNYNYSYPSYGYGYGWGGYGGCSSCWY